MSRKFIKYRERINASPKPGLRQSWTEVQVTSGLRVIGRYDTLAQAQKDHPDAVIAAGHKSKLQPAT